MRVTVAAREIQRTRFGEWLDGELRRQRLSRRKLAKRINPHDPEGARRNIARWTADIADAVSPSDASKDALAAALGVKREDMPDDEDEEDADVYAPLTRAVQDIVRREVERANDKEQV